MAKTPDTQRLRDLLARETENVPRGDMPAVAAALRRFYERALNEAKDRFGGRRRGLPCSRFLCRATDMVLCALREYLDEPSTGMCWVAGGGFGRALMSPGSTARLFLLHKAADPDVPKAAASRVREFLSRILIRSTVALHSVPEAVERMGRGALEASTLLETRFLGGSRSLYREFRRAVINDFLIPRWGTLGEQAFAESLSRRDPHTRSPYSTELNLKESAGCLRDVGTLQKLADALLQVPALAHLWADMGGEASGLLLPSERRVLQRALGFLVAVRNQLHFTLGPEFDVLEMRAQRQVAEELGYRPSAGAEGNVGQLMHDLYGHTGTVARVLRAASERFEHLRAVAGERLRGSGGQDLQRLASAL